MGSYYHAGYRHDGRMLCDGCVKPIAEAALAELGVSVNDTPPEDYYGRWSWPVDHGRYADAEVANLVGRWLHEDEAHNVPDPDEWYYSDHGTCDGCGIDL